MNFKNINTARLHLWKWVRLIIKGTIIALVVLKWLLAAHVAHYCKLRNVFYILVLYTEITVALKELCWISALSHGVCDFVTVRENANHQQISSILHAYFNKLVFSYKI